MFQDEHRRSLVRAARCFHSLDGYQTLMAMAALAGLKRIRDAFKDHVRLVRGAQGPGAPPGIALLWVPAEHRIPYTSTAGVEAACKAIDAENPSLEGSLTQLWPGAKDDEVRAAWKHLDHLDWSTGALLGPQVNGPAATDALNADGPSRRPMTAVGCVDVVGETYEMLKGELKINAGKRNGEFFTPENVTWLMVKMQDPKPGERVLDPCCGSGRMLVLAAAHLLQEHGLLVQETGPEHPLGSGRRLVVPPPALFVGQDIAPHGPAMGRISLTALGYLNAVFIVRDSLAAPATMEEVAGIIAARQGALRAVQSGHLVTDEVMLVAAAPELHHGLPREPALPETHLSAKPRGTDKVRTLDSFG